MKIYTKTGDKGSTSTFAGARVDKDSVRVEAYGTLDELNSLVGEIIATTKSTLLVKKLTRIQNELFILQSDIAAPLGTKIKIPRIVGTSLSRLEKEIDATDKSLPELKNFILPGGGEVGAKLHVARTVCRRAERAVVSLAKEEKISKHALAYINRLSDWFFVLARYINKEEKQPEVKWLGRKRRQH